jgi:hypothetical protein
MRKVFRYVVPVDDQPHSFQLTKGSPPLHVANGAARTHTSLMMPVPVVEFWAENFAGLETSQRWFRVYGTGHQVPGDASYRGTAPRTPEGLVWHLFEVYPDEG